jgi:hypothetical protein
MDPLRRLRDAVIRDELDRCVHDFDVATSFLCYGWGFKHSKFRIHIRNLRELKRVRWMVSIIFSIFSLQLLLESSRWYCI